MNVTSTSIPVTIAAVSSPATDPPVRRTKGERTRERLLTAAERVFVRDGYLEARVVDIAVEAGLSHGSFYTYFDSKQDVFRQVAFAVVKEVFASLDVAGEGTPEERIRAVNRRYFEVYEQHAGILGRIEQVATFDAEFREMRLELRRIFVDRIERGLRRLQTGGTKHDLDPVAAANALGGMIDNLAYTAFVLMEPIDTETTLETADLIWARALKLDGR
jgi:AcrR family transcriptional regulator